MLAFAESIGFCIRQVGFAHQVADLSRQIEEAMQQKNSDREAGRMRSHSQRPVRASASRLLPPILVLVDNHFWPGRKSSL